MRKTKLVKTLSEFLEDIYTIKFPRSQYVYHENFDQLYIRKGIYFFNHQKYQPAICIANIIAKEENKGYFSHLIKELRTMHPTVPIFVELVHNEVFVKKLLHMGFYQGSGDAYEKTFMLKVNV